MRRILFYSDSFSGENIQGGIEVATFRLAKALKESGQWEVYNAFRSRSDGKDKSVYSDVVKLDYFNRPFIRNLTDFIKKNEIDIVVNMSRFFRHKYIVKAVRKSGRDVKLVFMQHFAPGSEMKKPTYKSGFHLLRLNPFNPLYWLRASFYPLVKMPRNLQWSRAYKYTYENSERIVLLSQGYVTDFKRIADVKDDSKFLSIPNIFELNDNVKSSASAKDIKQKRVLIMSRMDEVQKRISLALKIWKKIEERGDLNEWHLDIVGTGHDVALEKRLAKTLKLKNITFHGWGERDRFMTKSPILMMTSEYEGLPLSILEALAYGCVPIAFDSYASLRDVVIDEENGIIVDNFGDIDIFADKLASLMRNEDKRIRLAKNASNATINFSSEKIVEQWAEMLSKL